MIAIMLYIVFLIYHISSCAGCFHTFNYSGQTGVVIITFTVNIQIRYRAESVSANEIANGILSSLVAITAGCAFVEYWGACLIGREHVKNLAGH